MKRWLLAACSVAALGQTGLDFPMAVATSPDGQYVFALSAGAKASLTSYAAATMKEVSRVPLEGAWLGLTFAPGGKRVYAGGGSRGSVYEFGISPQGELKRMREMKASDFIGGVALSPDGHLIYAADVFKNVIVVINSQSGRVIDQFRTGRRPYQILFHPDGKSYFVSSWADASVYQYNVANGEEIGRIRLAQHTTGMALSGYQPPAEEGQEPVPWRYRLFVAAANTNSVFVAGIGENKTMKLIDTISVAPAPLAPLGMTPSAVALSPDQKRLFVACSDANAVAIVNVSDTRGVTEGFLETGAYPAAVSALSNDRVVVVNAKGNTLTTLELETAKAWTEPDASPPASERAEHVIYLVHGGSAADVMHSFAGFVPDFTVKLGREPSFDLGDPANLPPAGYLWTNALAAGLSVRNYGVFTRNGKPLDPALAPYTKPDAGAFFDDMKEYEASAQMPRLILIHSTAGDNAAMVRETIASSRFRVNTRIVDSDPHQARALLGLRPTTRHDADGDASAGGGKRP